MINLQLELPEELFAVMHKNQKEMIDEIRLAAAVKLYEKGSISQERASELAGISRASFIYSLKDYMVSPFQYTADEIIDEANRFINE